MINNAIDKVYKKLFKDKVYTFKIYDVEVKYRINKVYVSTNEKYGSSTYTCNIVVESYKKENTWRGYYTQKSIRLRIGKLIRCHVGYDHKDMVGDLKYFAFSPKNHYHIDMIRWK